MKKTYDDHWTFRDAGKQLDIGMGGLNFMFEICQQIAGFKILEVRSSRKGWRPRTELHGSLI